MTNKRVGKVGVFGSCKAECVKGEPVRLSDGRIMQANRCPIGNICVVVSDEVIEGTTVDHDNPLSPAALYTLEELEQLGYGNISRGIGTALSGIAEDPESFIPGEDKPQAAESEFYTQYFNEPF